MEFDHRKSHVTEKNERSICIPIDKFPCKSKLKWRQNVALVLSESWKKTSSRAWRKSFQHTFSWPWAHIKNVANVARTSVTPLLDPGLLSRVYDPNAQPSTREHARGILLQHPRSLYTFLSYIICWSFCDRDLFSATVVNCPFLNYRPTQTWRRASFFNNPWTLAPAPSKVPKYLLPLLSCYRTYISNQTWRQARLVKRTPGHRQI